MKTRLLLLALVLAFGPGAVSHDPRDETIAHMETLVRQMEHAAEINIKSAGLIPEQGVKFRGIAEGFLSAAEMVRVKIAEVRSIQERERIRKGTTPPSPALPHQRQHSR